MSEQQQVKETKPAAAASSGERTEQRTEQQQRPERPERRPYRKGRGKRRKVCYFTVNKIEYIDYKDVELLKKFLHEFFLFLVGNLFILFSFFDRQFISLPSLH